MTNLACATKAQFSGITSVQGFPMRQIFEVGPVVVAVSILVACGQHGPITISPVSADAMNFPGGVVSFAASGVTNPTWCIGTTSGRCNGNIASAALIDSSGHARCLQGASGTVTVLAGMGVQRGNPDQGEQLSAFGKAQLTCP